MLQVCADWKSIFFVSILRHLASIVNLKNLKYIKFEEKTSAITF